VLLAPIASAQQPHSECECRSRIYNKPGLKLLSGLEGWEKRADPAHIVGPIYFVGTHGLGVFLIKTPAGHVLLNSGMPSSGPMILESLGTLGVEPGQIKFIINSHAHIDHAGAIAQLQERTKAPVRVLEENAEAMRTGGRSDFHYCDDLAFDRPKVVETLKRDEPISIGNVELIPHYTPGHSTGATTWEVRFTENGERFVVLFPDGMGINPGYRLKKNCRYPDIIHDYAETLSFLQGRQSTIWLSGHNKDYRLAEKLKRVPSEGVSAWIDPGGYAQFIKDKKCTLEKKTSQKPWPSCA